MGINFTRDTYNRLKKMDRKQLEDYITQTYEKGYRDGSEASKPISPDYEKIESRLKRIWGLGENKVGAIILALKEVIKPNKD